MAADLLDPLARAVRASSAPSSDYDLNPGIRLAENRVLRPAAVLIPVDLSGSDPRIWLTKRSSALQHHPGQVAFPGGKQDEADPDLAATALREANEEIGLPRAGVEVLGRLAPHETVTGFLVTPVIGLIRTSFSPRLQAGEVAEAFHVPVSHLLDKANFRVEGRRWRGQRRQYYTIPYGPYYVWGATARMLFALADAMHREADAA